MAKKIRFNAQDISTATYHDTVYLKLIDVAEAVGYKGVPQPSGEPIVVGSQSYFPLTGFEKLKSTGKRREMLVSLVAKVREVFKLAEIVPQYDDEVIQWANARQDVRIAKAMLAEAVEREAGLKDELLKGEV